MATGSDIAAPDPDEHVVPRSGGDAAGEAFVYAGADYRDEVGFVCCGGDIYDRWDRRVGHVTISASGEGHIYRGDDGEVGWVSLARGGDGIVRGRRDHHVLGLVTAHGEAYAGDPLAPVGQIRPATNVQLMAGAALLLGLGGETRREEAER